VSDVLVSLAQREPGVGKAVADRRSGPLAGGIPRLTGLRFTLWNRLTEQSVPHDGDELFSRRPSTVLRDCGGRKVPMQHLGVEPQTVRPDHGSGLGVHARLPKEFGIFERLEHLAPEVAREIDLAGHPIIEGQAELVFGQRLDSGDAEYHGLSLRQRIDGIQRSPFAGIPPTLVQLGLPQPRPFAHEAQRPRRQEALNYLPGQDCQLGPMLAVLRMEVRGKVLPPVHPYDDAVELAEPRHESPGVRLLGTRLRTGDAAVAEGTAHLLQIDEGSPVAGAAVFGHDLLVDQALNGVTADTEIGSSLGDRTDRHPDEYGHHSRRIPVSTAICRVCYLQLPQSAAIIRCRRPLGLGNRAAAARTTKEAPR